MKKVIKQLRIEKNIELKLFYAKGFLDDLCEKVIEGITGNGTIHAELSRQGVDVNIFVDMFCETGIEEVPNPVIVVTDVVVKNVIVDAFVEDDYAYKTEFFLGNEDREPVNMTDYVEAYIKAKYSIK